MSSSVPGAVAGLREALLAAAGTDSELATLLHAYLAPVPEPDLLGLEPEALASLARTHLAARSRRTKGEHLVEVLTPGPAGAIVLVVSEDQPFLVDTVILELTRQEWSLRRLFHPQPQVTRDAEGQLLTLGSGPTESWIAVEAYPPLGKAAADLTDALAAGLHIALDTVTATYTDWQPMLARCREAIAELWAGGRNRPEVAAAVDLLDWLAAEHFVFLGYARYEAVAGGLAPVAGTGLGPVPTAVPRVAIAVFMSSPD